MKKRWANTKRVEIDNPMRDIRGPRGSDQWKFWHLSLGLLINRHVAEAIPDSVVSEHLDHVWNSQKHLLPFDGD